MNVNLDRFQMHTLAEALQQFIDNCEDCEDTEQKVQSAQKILDQINQQIAKAN